jgi:putative (di)nucleoside polyphosphate hydrolase
MPPKLPDNVFRANTGAVIINAAGLVLAFERLKMKGAWQLPQGGLAVGEEAEAAVYREIEEETGIRKADLSLLAVHPHWLAYELSPAQRRPKLGRGQVQKWFLFRFIGDENAIDVVNVAGKQEFAHWRWMPFNELTAQVVAFKQPIYQQLAQTFAQYLKP